MRRQEPVLELSARRTAERFVDMLPKKADSYDLEAAGLPAEPIETGSLFRTNSSAFVLLLYKLFENADRIVTRKACVRECMRFRRQQV